MLSAIAAASGRRALDVCAEIGRGYHRTETESRVRALSGLLDRLASVVMEAHWHDRPPMEVVNEAASG